MLPDLLGAPRGSRTDGQCDLIGNAASPVYCPIVNRRISKAPTISNAPIESAYTQTFVLRRRDLAYVLARREWRFTVVSGCASFTPPTGDAGETARTTGAGRTLATGTGAGRAEGTGAGGVEGGKKAPAAGAAAGGFVAAGIASA